MPAVRPVPVNAAFLDEDMRLWNEYKRVPSPDNLVEIDSAINDGWHAAIVGNTPVQEALDDANEAIQDLL